MNTGARRSGQHCGTVYPKFLDLRGLLFVLEKHVKNLLIFYCILILFLSAYFKCCSYFYFKLSYVNEGAHNILICIFQSEY